MLKPYYDQDGITIYHGDCADVLPLVEPSTVALLLTDPPYGINYDPQSAKFGESLPHDRVIGDARPFDPDPLLIYPRVILWGANCYADKLPPHPGWLVWDKVIQNGLDLRIAEVEFAWSNFITRSQVFRHMWSGAYRATERSLFVHPTQKPVALMRWILDKWSKPGDLVFDPYMGSGPIAQACHEMGRRYIGVEIVEDYCKIAVGRLAQGVLAFGEG